MGAGLATLRDRPVLWGLLPLLVACVAHGAALWSGYVLFDDREMLLEHPQLDALAQWPGLFARDYFAHAGHAHGMYRPLALLAFAADRAGWGGNPVGLHLTNLLLHAATAVAVTALAWRVRLPWRWAVLAGCLFAANPVHAETVGWIVGRCDGIATLGAVLALTAHLAGRPWVAAACLLFGLGGKESAAAVVPLAGLLAWGGWHPAGADRPQAWKRAALAAGVIVLVYAGLRFNALGEHFLPSSFGRAGLPTAQLLLPERLLLFGQSAARMFAGMTVGVGLCADHSAAPAYLYPAGALFTVQGLALSLTAAVTWCAALVHTRRSGLAGLGALGLAWIGVSWLPVAQIAPIRVVQADRFCSLASVGWAFAATALCLAFARRARAAGRSRGFVVWAVAIGPVFASALVLVSWWRSAAFSGPADHARDVLERYPFDAQAWNRLGIYFDERGEHEKAERRYRRAFDITASPEGAQGRAAPSVYMNLGTLYLETDRPLQAQVMLEHARRHVGRSAKLDLNLARLYTRLNEPERAIALYNTVLKRWPVRAGRPLARLYAAEDQHVAAVAAYRAALRHAPGDARLHEGLADSLLEIEQTGEAVAMARRGVALFPTWAQAYLTLGRALLAAGDPDGARAALESAVARGREGPAAVQAREVLHTLQSSR